MLHFHQIADPEELDQAAQAIRQAHRDTVRRTGLSERDHPDYPGFITVERLAGCAADPDHHLYGVYMKTDLIGAFCFDTADTAFIRIRFLCLLPRYRKQGYGERVLRYLTDLLLSRGMPRMAVELPAQDTESADWFVRHGFGPDKTAEPDGAVSRLVKELVPRVDTFA